MLGETGDNGTRAYNIPEIVTIKIFGHRILYNGKKVSTENLTTHPREVDFRDIVRDVERSELILRQLFSMIVFRH